ncbi:hypothetical protein DERP_009768 [Dermatophagoides pteronyssinus]|uniref:Uncharacterized protein n=1 Tax=Dermatophagoides pteronyssinus TaxID=6956 RepID=A0ABQ8IR36_DERPT|nr:hypothetical protein DERP_009768 [Dermatophagoides pteronyssinus]
MDWIWIFIIFQSIFHHINATDQLFPPLSSTNHPDCNQKNEKISLAVMTEKHLKLQPIHDDHHSPPPTTNIVIKSNDNELKLKFLSQSSSIHLEQLITQPKHYLDHQHQYEQQEIFEPPIRLKQVIKKPIHQDIHEIIIPTKTILQEILPLKQIIKTIVPTATTNNDHHHHHGGHHQHSKQQPLLSEKSPVHHGQEEDETTTTTTIESSSS